MRRALICFDSHPTNRVRNSTSVIVRWNYQLFRVWTYVLIIIISKTLTLKLKIDLWPRIYIYTCIFITCLSVSLFLKMMLHWRSISKPNYFDSIYIVELSLANKLPPGLWPSGRIILEMAASHETPKFSILGTYLFSVIVIFVKS